jgi:large subunit ribosomal protein L33
MWRLREGGAGEASAMRENIVLACGECKRRNYTSTKNKKTKQDRLEFKKYCRSCKKHTAHKETR